MPDRIRGVLFDKDGTLFDFAATWRAATRALLVTLAPEDADMRRRLGHAVGFDPETGVFEANSIIVAGAADQVAGAWAGLLPGFDAPRLEAAANRAAAAIGGPTLSPAAEDLPGLLRELRERGLALGVATHDSAEAARAHLAAVDALHLFDFIAGYDSGWGMKPGPGMVLAFADHARIAPRQIVMVGDSLHDMGAARAAGAWAIGVLTGPASRDDLDPHADAVLPSIAALPHWLDSRAANRARGAAGGVA